MTQRREMRDGVREARRNVRGLGVFRLVKRCVCTFFFFFFEFRLDSAVSADTGRYGRYGPSRPDFGHVGADFRRIGADFSRVGPIRDLPRGTTRSDAARTRGLRHPCRVPPRWTRVRWPGSRVRASQMKILMNLLSNILSNKEIPLLLLGLKLLF